MKWSTKLDTFGNAFFTYLSAVPHTIYTDNATIFQASNKELITLWNTLSSKNAQKFYAENGIRWKFIVPPAAWWRGWRERNGRRSTYYNCAPFTKCVLTKTLPKSELQEDVTPRHTWKRARVEELILSHDEQVRTCVLLANGCTITRPVQLVIPLEVDQDGEDVARLKFPKQCRHLAGFIYL
ncbi:integrase catalytic domain-containing protein [Trichonephila inaurata madagascariensis]|uniref:Integrase catalytic domain-containing protein n=1 Tax=Trichonephila inaurata madagascariensis TaxID=2747483 RepID=A0A8X6IYU1_9ARAC|nr:integrase catalytic domain-containing protein [Trichonephila inaurata madagascariensis]